MSTRWSQAGSQRRPTLRALHLPQQLWAARTVQSPNAAPKFSTPCQEACLPRNGESGILCCLTHASVFLSTPAPSHNVMQVGPDCEGGGLQGRQPSGFGPAMRTSGAAQDRDRGEGTPHFSPQDGWGLRKLAAETQGQAYPPGGCGLLRLNSRVGGGQTTQPWVSPDTVPPSCLGGTCPEPQRARTGAEQGLGPLGLETHPELGLAL